MEISLIFNTVSHRQNISVGYFIGKKVTDKQMNSNFINIDLVLQGCIGEFEGTVCDDGDIQLLKDFNMPTLVTDEVLESWDVDSSFNEKCPVVK